MDAEYLKNTVLKLYRTGEVGGCCVRERPTGSRESRGMLTLKPYDWWPARCAQAEALLPVFSTILSFSPDEQRSCKEGLKRIQEVGAGACLCVVGGPTGGRSINEAQRRTRDWCARAQGEVPLAAAAAVVDSSLSAISSLSSWTAWALGSSAATTQQQPLPVSHSAMSPAASASLLHAPLGSSSSQQQQQQH